MTNIMIQAVMGNKAFTVTSVSEEDISKMDRVARRSSLGLWKECETDSCFGTVLICNEMVMSLPVPFDHSHFLLGYTSVNRSGVKFPKFLSSKFFLSYHYFSRPPPLHLQFGPGRQILNIICLILLHILKSVIVFT